jgi:hypothetical protein
VQVTKGKKKKKKKHPEEKKIITPIKMKKRGQ